MKRKTKRRVHVYRYHNDWFFNFIVLSALALAGLLLLFLTFSQHPVSTASWKTYTSAKYGFSFKHPINFIVNEQETMDTYSVLVTNFPLKDLHTDPVKKNPDDKDVFEMSIYRDRTADDTNLSTQLLLNNQNTSYLKTTFSNFKIDMEFGYKLMQTTSDYPNDPIFWVITVHNKKIFSFHLRNQTKENTQIYDQILSTFKFTQ